MKKATIILAIAFVLTSCSDFLNIKPRGYDIASKLEHYEGMIYGSDPYLLFISFPFMCMETYTDEAGYANAYSTAGSYICNGYKWEKDIYREDEAAGEWNSYTTLLYHYNVIISEVMDAEDGTEAERLAVLSEARMLRAYCTYMMSTFFGDVPIITQASTMDTNFELKSKEEVDAFVLKEMSESVPYLRDAPEHFMRIFKPTGYGLYGKMLFMMGRYDEAATQFEECFRLLEGQPSVHLIDYKPLMDANGDIDYPVRADVNPEILFNMAMMSRLWDAVNSGLYGMLMFGVKNEVLETYFPDRHDCRLAFHSAVSNGVSAYKAYKPREVYSANMSNITTNTGLDLPEVYTMYAECLARAGRTDEAAALLLELRSHRMDEGHEAIPAEISSREDFIRFAFSERMREQFGFGTSWFDMKRLWNDPLFQDMKAFYTHTIGAETYTLTEDRLTLAYPPQVLAWHPEYVNNN